MSVAIVTINYNNRQGLERTINSVKAQTLAPDQWIVIDGGSTDGSADLISAHSTAFTYHVSEPDSGIYDAMNKGMAHASADYVLFLNSGDALADDSVLADFKALGAAADLLCGDTLRTDASGSVVGDIKAPDNISLLYFFNNNLNHQAVFFSSRVLAGKSYNQKWRMCADRDLILRILLSGATYQHWHRYVARYDITGFSSVNARDMKAESDLIMQSLLPPCVSTDYLTLVQMRDVDLSRWISSIIRGPRLLRNVARLLLYPLYRLSRP